MLPSPAPTIRQQYDRLIEDLERQIARLRPILGTRLHCRPGCAGCCQPFSVFALEAAVIAQEASGLTLPPAPGVCAFLRDDLCRIYPFRPLICRSQGLPLAYADLDRQCLEVSACPVNFPADSEFVMEELLFLDETNQRLAALNILYCRDNCFDAGRRVPLSRIFPL
jgi:Fe-S-cluster containining protein